MQIRDWQIGRRMPATAACWVCHAVQDVLGQKHSAGERGGEDWVAQRHWGQEFCTSGLTISPGDVRHVGALGDEETAETIATDAADGDHAEGLISLCSLPNPMEFPWNTVVARV